MAAVMIETCTYCDRQLGVPVVHQGVTLTLTKHRDHFHPRCEGGADTLDNLVVACDVCNTFKGTKVYASIQAVREACAAFWASPDFDARRKRLAIEGRREGGRRAGHAWSSPEVRAARLTGMRRSEAVAKKRAGNQAAMLRPGVKDKAVAVLGRPDVRAKCVVAARAASNRPEVKAKNVAVLARPDVVVLRLEALRSPQVRAKTADKLRALWATPEYRARMTAALRGRKFSAGACAARKLALSRPETRAKMRASRLAYLERQRLAQAA